MWLRCRLVAIPSGVRSRWPMASVRSAVSGGGPCSGLVRAASSTAWALPTRDEPVRAGRGQVVLGQVSGVGHHNPDHVPGGIGGRRGGVGVVLVGRWLAITAAACTAAAVIAV